MSKEPQPRKVIAVPLESVLAELGELRKYIEALQAQIDQVSSELEDVIASRNLISELKTSKPDELFMPSDRRGLVLIRAKPLSKDKVVIHVGVNYYVEMGLEEAMEVLSRIEREGKEVLATLQRELNNALTYYQQLQGLVSQALSRRGGTGVSKGT